MFHASHLLSSQILRPYAPGLVRPSGRFCPVDHLDNFPDPALAVSCNLRDSVILESVLRKILAHPADIGLVKLLEFHHVNEPVIEMRETPELLVGLAHAAEYDRGMGDVVKAAHGLDDPAVGCEIVDLIQDDGAAFLAQEIHGLTKEILALPFGLGPELLNDLLAGP